ncbi:MAG TPA: DUF4038 domain-containing protein [Terriglobia bacterium]|nr:DUF4038 domain-containing protein [Terriglobia bacterium]
MITSVSTSLIAKVQLLLSALVSLGVLAAVTPSAAAPPQNGTASPAAYPVKVSANGRYLVDRNGIPFLIVGDTPQGLMGRLTEAQAESYFANRQRHGFNSLGWIDVACAGPDYPSNKDAATPDGIRPFTGYLSGGTDFAHYDLSKPNEVYFTRLDHIVTLAAKHGLLVFIDPIETIGWLPTLRNNGLDASYAYGQYLGRRYKGFANVAWLNGNDFNTWKDPKDDALVLAVAKGIKAEDPAQVQTVELNVHTSSSLDDPAWAPLIALNSTYTYSPTYIQMLHSYNQKPVIPDYLVEAHYDWEEVGKPPDFGTPSVLRREEYWTMLSGGTGQFYGNKYTWSFAPGWESHIDTVGVSQLTIWKDFFSSLPWQDLVPDQDHAVVTAGLGTYGTLQTRVSQSDYCTAAKTPDGSFVVVYLPTARTITVNLAGLKAPARARWFDPTNGDYIAIPGGPAPNTGALQFTPPGENHEGADDWVLLLDGPN